MRRKKKASERTSPASFGLLDAFFKGIKTGASREKRRGFRRAALRNFFWKVQNSRPLERPNWSTRPRIAEPDSSSEFFSHPGFEHENRVSRTRRSKSKQVPLPSGTSAEQNT